MNQDSTKCSWTRDHIDVYLDGELDPHDVQLFEAHLDVCAGCREEVEIGRRLVSELRELPELHCPDSVVDTVLDEAGAADDNSEREGWLAGLRRMMRRPAFAPAMAGAFVILIVVSAVFVGEINRTSEYSDEEIQLAGEQLKWALGYVGKVSHDAAITYRDDVLGERVAKPMTDAVMTHASGANNNDSNGGN